MTVIVLEQDQKHTCLSVCVLSRQIKTWAHFQRKPLLDATNGQRVALTNDDTNAI